MSHLVFVYGTLKQNGSRNGVLRNSEFIANTRTKNPEFNIQDQGSFPFMSKGQHYIAGEVYRIDATTLRTLDYIEGHPDFYLRQTTEVEGIAEPVFYYSADVLVAGQTMQDKHIRLDTATNTKSWSPE